ncbi:aspartate/glutamate racemase family protein [Paraburkholderia dilworthii]|uniref:Aspartate/glutamate racemase family protein n=2 Tax=Paraburkholderia dilworthii TaxID=948106 RepID=A0ABW9DHH1_9BURK
MHEILLLNPNTSTETTAMMVAIARSCVPSGYTVSGETAARGVPMILDAEHLHAAGGEVVESWARHVGKVSGIVISAFGDPGIDLLRGLTDVPIVGICESSILEAARGGRRFGIATVTPDLVKPIDASVDALGLSGVYTGIRLTSEDPQELASDPLRLEEALADAVVACIEQDGAEAVVIGGGPLGQAAIGLAHRFRVPVIAPIPAAMRKLTEILKLDL